MAESGKRPILSTINEKTKKVRKSRFSIPIYILTVFLASVWLIFINPCLMNILLPILALLIPFKLYDENNLKKLLVVGVVAILLLAFTMSFYQTFFIYDQPSTELDSVNRRLQNGTIEPIYGDSDTKFNFTVEVSKDLDEEEYTLYANLSYAQAGGIREKDYEGYKMYRVNDTDDNNETIKYYRVVEDLPERIFNHYFSLEGNLTLPGGETYVGWVSTKKLGFGPVTLPRRKTLGMITLQQSFSTSVIFLLGVGLLWLKKRMDKSVIESTEGLEEKEKELEDHCPECGHLLEGKKECDRCGWMKEPEDEMYREDGEPD